MFGIKTMFKFKGVNNGILEGLNSVSVQNWDMCLLTGARGTRQTFILD
jgi:hypothetical protein